MVEWLLLSLLTTENGSKQTVENHQKRQKKAGKENLYFTLIWYYCCSYCCIHPVCIWMAVDSLY